LTNAKIAVIKQDGVDFTGTVELQNLDVGK
jgi:hypothetical protein